MCRSDRNTGFPQLARVSFAFVTQHVVNLSISSQGSFAISVVAVASMPCLERQRSVLGVCSRVDCRLGPALVLARGRDSCGLQLRFSDRWNRSALEGHRELYSGRLPILNGDRASE